MKMAKQTAFEFYASLEKQFPKIKKLQILKGIDLKEDGFENSGIMTKLAEELTQFVINGKLQEAILLMNNVLGSLQQLRRYRYELSVY